MIAGNKQVPVIFKEEEEGEGEEEEGKGEEEEGKGEEEKSKGEEEEGKGEEKEGKGEEEEGKGEEEEGKGEEKEGKGEEEEGKGEEEEGKGEEEEGKGEEKEEGEGEVKCIIAEVKKAAEDAGMQTRAKMYAMLANRVATALQRGQVVDSTIAYGLVLRKSGIRLYMGCAFFSDSGNMTFEMSTLRSTTKTDAKVMH